jgi:patatin-like phospholipase/acyl hydrolase
MPRILALDGGGVRGLSSLLILQRLMQEVHRIMEEQGDSRKGSKPPLPCEYFDLICGTSTGGLIAIMLGRLRMVCPVSKGFKVDVYSPSMSVLKNTWSFPKEFSD